MHGPEVLANHENLLRREARLRQFGCDLSAAVAFVLARALPLGGCVLEIGTGKGRFLVELARRVSRVSTVDISPEEQRCARLNARRAGVENKIEFVVQDAARLPWPDRSFDAAVTVNALHHIRDLRPVLNEMLRVVKPGGKLLLADFGPRGFRSLERAHQAEGKTHPREVHDLLDLRRFLRERGAATRLCGGCNEQVLLGVLPPAKPAR